MRRLLIVPGIPGRLGGGSECREPARMAAAAAAAAAVCGWAPPPAPPPLAELAEPAAPLAASPADEDEETLNPLDDVLTSLPPALPPFSAVEEEGNPPL